MKLSAISTTAAKATTTTITAAATATDAATPATHVRRGVLEVRTAAKSSALPIARFRYPCGLSTEPAAETIRR